MTEKKHILLVENNPTLCERFRQGLLSSIRDIEVMAFTSHAQAAEAVERLYGEEHKTIDLAIIDCTDPAEGNTLISDIREGAGGIIPGGENVPVIALASKESPLDDGPRRVATASRYEDEAVVLQRPVSVEDMIPYILDLLQHGRQGASTDLSPDELHRLFGEPAGHAAKHGLRRDTRQRGGGFEKK